MLYAVAVNLGSLLLTLGEIVGGGSVLFVLYYWVYPRVVDSTARLARYRRHQIREASRHAIDHSDLPSATKKILRHRE